MFDIQRYIEDGTVQRTKIAIGIKYRDIGTEELRALVNDPVVKASFFEEGYDKKIPKKQWTERYLDELPFAAVADCFNEEYLYYLNDVAEYVQGKKRRKKNCRLALGAAVLVVVLAALVWVVAWLIL